MGFLLLVILLVLLVAGLPAWPHGGFGYGWYPSGGLGLVVLILLVLLLAGRL